MKETVIWKIEKVTIMLFEYTEVIYISTMYYALKIILVVSKMCALKSMKSTVICILAA